RRASGRGAARHDPRVRAHRAARTGLVEQAEDPSRRDRARQERSGEDAPRHALPRNGGAVAGEERAARAAQRGLPLAARAHRLAPRHVLGDAAAAETGHAEREVDRGGVGTFAGRSGTRAEGAGEGREVVMRAARPHRSLATLGMTVVLAACARTPAVPTYKVEAVRFTRRVTADGNLKSTKATPLLAPPDAPGPMKSSTIAPDAALAQKQAPVARFDPT